MTTPFPTALEAAYPLIDFHPVTGNALLQDDSDGNGPRIVYWDEDALGPQPTETEIEAMLAAPPPLPPEVEPSLEDRLAAIEAVAIAKGLFTKEELDTQVTAAELAKEP